MRIYFFCFVCTLHSLIGCATIGNERQDDLQAKLIVRKFEQNEDCSARGVQLFYVKPEFGPPQKVKMTPLYLDEGIYTFFYVDKYGNYGDRECSLVEEFISCAYCSYSKFNKFMRVVHQIESGKSYEFGYRGRLQEL